MNVTVYYSPHATVLKVDGGGGAMGAMVGYVAATEDELKHVLRDYVRHRRLIEFIDPGVA